MKAGVLGRQVTSWVGTISQACVTVTAHACGRAVADAAVIGSLTSWSVQRSRERRGRRVWHGRSNLPNGCGKARRGGPRESRFQTFHGGPMNILSLHLLTHARARNLLGDPHSDGRARNLGVPAFFLGQPRRMNDG